MKEFSEEVFEKIDLYLNDQMNPVDRSGFESMMASDLDLKHEVELQQDIVKSIQNKEIQRIKSNLNSISVSLTPAMLQTKWLVTYAVATVIGLGSYVAYSYYDNDDNPHNAAYAITQKGEHINYYEDEQNLEKGSAVVDKSVTIMKDRRVEEGQKINEIKGTSQQNTIQKNAGTPGFTSDVNQANLVAVDDNDVDDDFNKQGVEVAEKPASSNKGDGSEVELVIKNTKSKHVEYQFYDDKLYLYGNFKPSEPYVIYDIPTHYGTEYYFKIASKYYRLEPNQVERKELEPITNPELIKELDSK